MLHKEATPALAAKGCPVDRGVDLATRTNQIGTRNVEYDAEHLAKLGLTSNCFREGNDPNNATHKGVASCTAQYDMKDANGNVVRNSNMRFSSSLHVCDLSEEALPQVYEDLRKVAARNASQKGYEVEKPEHLACNFSILPSV